MIVPFCILVYSAKKKEEKQQAYHLFVHGGLSLTQIHELIGVSKPTLTKWNQEENWQSQKAAQSLYNSIIRCYLTSIKTLWKTKQAFLMLATLI